MCDKLYLIVNKIRQSNLKRLVIGSAADFSHASRFVIDLSAVKDTNEEVLEAVASFKTMYPDTRVIVIADREPPDSPIFARLFDMCVYDIVTDPDGDGLKKSLTTGMTKEDVVSFQVEKPDLTGRAKEEKAVLETTTDPAPPPVTESITANRDFKKHKQFVTVAVCATEPHMGATHHALLMTKFLCGVGFRVCYLEASERRNILYLARAYTINANENKRLLQFEGVDMYFDFRLPEVIGAGYDFLVFDLGRFGEFESASFLTKDIKVVVSGAKAWEMPAYNAVFGTIEGCRDVQFVMNHAPPDEQDGIRALMGGYTTYFSEYAPYPFATGVNPGIYKDIFRDYLTIERVEGPEPERARKRGFFNRRR